jgi:inner membrane protein
MDWQGSYGLRPFLPWSERWYYGDFVAIVDAWYWLVPLVALAWGASRHWRPALWYGLLLVPTTFAVLLLDQPALWVKVGWVVVAAVGVIGWVRHWFGPARAGLAAAVAVGVLALYAGAQAAAALPVKAELRRAATARFGPHAASAALTIPGRPFVWQPMLAGADTIAGRDWALPRNLGVPAVRRALTDTQEGRAMAIFARFLAARVDSADTPVRVHLWDVRYGGPGGGWAAVTVTLP